MSRQLAALLATSTQQRADEGRRLAARSSLKALIDAPDDAAALSEAQIDLAAFLKTSPQTVGVEVWGAGGVRLLELVQTESPAVKGGPPPSRTTAPTALGFSPLQPFRDGAFYELVTPIAGASATGSFLLRRMITMPNAAPAAVPNARPNPAPNATAGAAPAAGASASAAPGSRQNAAGNAQTPAQAQTQASGIAAMIGGLIGNGMSFKFGSKDGVWTDLSTIVPPPPDAASAANAVASGRDVLAYTMPDGEQRLGVGVPVHDTPWSLWVAIPRAVALAPANVFLRRALPVIVIVVVLGCVFAWFAARRVTGPLDELTAAADAIAAGDLTRRARIGAKDEFGRLGVVFNAMASRVEEGYHLLEDRVKERTASLEQALETVRSTQEELVRREKLAMLGQLASGVGHELRNPLGVMTNAVYFLEMVQPNAEPVVKEYHALLRAQIGLSEKIVSDLLDFARIKPPRREIVPLSRLIDDQLARVSVSENVRVVRELPADLPPLHVDPVQVGQVVLNLLVNAVQAMEEHGGVLTLRGSIDDGRVRLDVIDTGPGVKPELQEKIFEALFTTKARGIGLGLAVSRSLAEANHGNLTLTSRPGQGATFTLIVPAVAVMEPAR